MKYQLTSRMPLTAARSAGQRPPSAAVHDDEQQEEEQDARQADLPAQVGEHVGEHGRSEDGEHEAERDAPLRQRGGPARPREREGLLGRVRVADDVDVDAACRSPRITLPITEPLVRRCHRERRLAPITICVTFSERAASRRASPMSSPTTSW